jgi:hypothetical protein
VLLAVLEALRAEFGWWGRLLQPLIIGGSLWSVPPSGSAGRPPSTMTA